MVRESFRPSRSALTQQTKTGAAAGAGGKNARSEFRTPWLRIAELLLVVEEW